MAERTTFARSSESELIDLLSDSDGEYRASLTLENESASQVILESTGDGDDDDDDDDVVCIQHNPTSARGTTLLHTAISDYGFRLTTGEKVLLDDDTKFHVHRIVKNTVNNTIHLFGWKLILPVEVEFAICKHTKKPLSRLLPQDFNELVAVLRIQQGQIGKFDGDLVLDSVPLSRAVGVCEVIYTNRPFPAYSYYEAGIRTKDHTINGVFFPKTHDKARAKQFAPAVCRRKFVEEFDLLSKKKVAKQLLWLEPDECDLGKSSADVVKARKFREDITARSKEESVQPQQNDRFEVHGNVPQRGKKRARESGETIDLTDDDRANRLEERPRLNNNIARNAPPRARAGGRRNKFSFVNICAGGGLVSRAATLAGLEVAAGLDVWSVACKSLSLNFPAMEIIEMDVHDFCVYSGFNTKVVGDVMWISWPRQPHSYQKRGQNPERDAKNIATGYALSDLIL
ncbi:hypothetical protein KC315_g18154, partial [Hortaea werneckii]